MKKSRRILLISLPVMFAILLFLLSKNKHETVVSTSTVKAEVQSLTTVKETEQSVYVEIVNGAQLERDIIPQLMDVFHLSEDEVKKELSKAAAQVYSESSGDDFRQYEGILPVGSLPIIEKSLGLQLQTWARQSDSQIKSLLASIPADQRNQLSEGEVLRLASIVEAEALQNEFKSEVAAVFLNRLEHGMRLQSCVTVEYALGFQRPFLLYKDIETVDPYNTYANDGLPPTPICSVDQESLLVAATVSQDKDNLFFFYDYIDQTMQFFSDYEEFKTAAAASQKKFEAESSVEPFSTVNKQEIYGVR